MTNEKSNEKTDEPVAASYDVAEEAERAYRLGKLHGEDGLPAMWQSGRYYVGYCEGQYYRMRWSLPCPTCNQPVWNSDHYC